MSRILAASVPTTVVAASDASKKARDLATYRCNGTADDVEIQAAIDALPSGGGRVILSEGTFYIASTALLDSNLAVVGQGMGATAIQAASGLDADVVQGRLFSSLTGTNSTGGESRVLLRDLTIDGNKANQASGWCLRKYGYRWNLENVEIRNGKDGNYWSEWGLGAAPEGGMDDHYRGLHSHLSDGLGIDFRGPHDSHFLDLMVFKNGGGGAKFSKTAAVSGSGCKIVGGHVWAGGVGNTLIGVELSDVELFISRCDVEGYGGAGGRGISLPDGTSTLFANGLYVYINATGILLCGAGSHIDGRFQGNTVAAVDLGIAAGVDSHYNRITGHFRNNKIDLDFSNSAGYNYADIWSLPSASQDTVAGTRHATDEVHIGKASTGGAGTAYLTENSGTATLANGNTSVVVTHGLGVTPAAGDIMVTPIEAWGAMTEFYIDTYTSTQFTIHADQDPTQDVDFAWKALVL